MKKSLPLLLFVATVATTTTAFGQAAQAPDAKTEAQLIALEKHAWEAWKTRDVAWLKANTAEEFTLTSAGSTSTKEQYLTTGLDHCQVKSYALTNFKVTMLDANAAQLTYAATQSAVCSGKASSPSVRAVANYVRRGGKWLGILYMETPATK